MAALLCSGSTGAWGELMTYTVFSQDYESAVDASSWQSPNLMPTLVTGDATYGNYIQHNVGRNNDRSTYTIFGKGLLDEYDSYTLEFDMNVKTGSEKTTEFAVMTEGYVNPANNATFSSKNSGMNYLLLLSIASTKKVTVNQSETTYNNPNEVWCHYKIEVSETDRTAKYTITNKSDESILSSGTYNIPEGTSSKVTGFYVLEGRYWGTTCVDNILITTQIEATAIKPTIALSGINGQERTYSISFLEGETLYYKGPNETEYLSTTTNPFSYAASVSGTLSAYTVRGTATSEPSSVEIDATEVTLNAPTGYRTGAHSYVLTQVSTVVEGLSAVQTLHYTIGGGEEKTSTAASLTITDVEGDIVAWSSATGYTKSSDLSIEYVAPINTVEKWSVDLNEYPKTYNINAIANAIDSETATELNGLTVYNLQNETPSDLYVENSSGWLLRPTNASNRWKAQSAVASIVINNVKWNEIIYVNAVHDKGTYSINGLVNAGVKYDYSSQEYFIAPIVEGPVTITFKKGVSINKLALTTIAQAVPVSSVGYATFVPSTNVVVPAGVTVYTAKVNDDKASLALTAVAEGTVLGAGQGFIVKAEENTYNFAVTTAEAATLENDLLAADAPIEVSEESSIYVLAQPESSPVGFYRVKAGTIVAAGKAYIDLTAAKNAAPALTFADSATGISEVKTAGVNAATADFYTLQGVKVNKNTRGLLLHNGKKYLVK